MGRIDANQEDSDCRVGYSKHSVRITQNGNLRNPVEHSRCRGFRKYAYIFISSAVLVNLIPNVASSITISIDLENDAFFPGAGDDDYTSGCRVNVGFNSPQWWPRFLSRFNNNLETCPVPYYATTLMVGQNLYSPRDIEDPRVQQHDRPYSAWLYFGVATTEATKRGLRIFELHVGTTGKDALGEQIQTWVHGLRIVNAPKPEGWDHQVEPVPGRVGVNLIGKDTYAFHLVEADSIPCLDAMPYYRITLGNVHTNAAVGTYVRFGRNLQPRLPAKIDPTKLTRAGVYRLDDSQESIVRTKWSIYGFVGIEVRFVGWNALLQHRTYTPRRLNPIKRAVVDIETGIELKCWMVNLGYRMVWRSPEYDGGRKSKYGGVFTTIDF